MMVELRTVLLPRRRKPYFGLILYLPTRDIAVALVTLLDNIKRTIHDAETARFDHVAHGLRLLTGNSDQARPERFRSIVPACMEWFSSSVAQFLTPARRDRLNDAYGCLYVEQELHADQDPMDVVSEWADLVELINSSVSDRFGALLLRLPWTASIFDTSGTNERLFLRGSMN